MGWDEVLIKTYQNEKLRPPVLSVRRILLKMEETIAGSLKTQTSHTIAPLLLSTKERERKKGFKREVK